MAGNFEPIGFSVQSAADVEDLCQNIMPQCDKIPAPNGHYLHWAGKSGAEIWIFVDAGGQLVTLAPAFTGKGRVRVNVIRIFPRDSAGAEGGLNAWANPPQKPVGKENGDYPFVFDSPDFALHPLQLPALRSAQVTAFAQELSVFADEAAFNQRETQPKLAARSFIPTGLFIAAKSGEPPPAYALLNGEVTAVEPRVNEISGKPFVWATVETLGGTYDIVFPPGMVAQAVEVGNIVSGSFWLSGRLL